MADAAIKQMILAGLAPQKAKTVILGLTFKENCPDIRNSKVADIIKRLGEYGITPQIVDPWADSKEAKREYGVELTTLDKVKDADCIIVAVAHKEFKDLDVATLTNAFKKTSEKKGVLIDVKGIYSIKQLQAHGLRVWRL